MFCMSTDRCTASVIGSVSVATAIPALDSRGLDPMCAHENAVRTPEFSVQADANGGRIADDVANTVWRVHDDYYPVSENPGPFHGVMEPLALHCGLTQITTELPQMASTSPRQ